MKKSRSSASSPAFGLLAWLANTRVALPLKGVECRFEVTGAIACVELDQIYHQNTSRPLDCTYTFPLLTGAAVYRCELHVNGRVIRAKVEAQETARRIFRQQKAAGRRTALVETERENVFTLSLGNLQPGDVIVVRFAWFQTLDRAGDTLRLFVPTCPGVRYIPGQPLLRAPSGRGTADDTDQVPDASRITPPRIDALHPDAAYFSIQGRLAAADVASGTASSPSHPLYVRESAAAVLVELSGRAAVPDRDFVLAWQEPKAKQLAPQAWQWAEGTETYALVQLRAPESVPVEETFTQDLYFLVDQSGSMEGAKWQQTCAALRAFVGQLGTADRVWITLFASSYRDFAEAPRPAAEVLADRGFREMEALGTGGGTALLTAAEHVLEQLARHSADRRASVVLITDGQVGNDDEIVRAFREVPRVRVHAFGIDTAVNDAFLRALAAQQGGGCWLQTPDDDIAGTIAALGGRLRRPVLTDLAVRGSWTAGRPTWPDLHAREVVTLALRGEAASALEITGRLADGREQRIEVDLGAVGSEAIKLLWAKQRIAALLAADRPAEALALARQHNLLCAGAAFIAWDEAEQAAVAEEEIVQPSLMPSRLYASQRLHSAPSGDDSVVFESPCLDHEFVADSADGEARFEQFRAEFERKVVERVRADFRNLGVSKHGVEALTGWAQSHDGDAPTMFVALLEAAELISRLRRDLDTPLLRDRLEPQIESAFRAAPEVLLQWAAASRQALRQLTELVEKLGAAEVPRELIDHLLAWVMEPTGFRPDRLEKLASFVETLDRQPFSFDSEVRCWRAFLELAGGSDSEVYAVALRWRPELAGVLSPSPVPDAV